MCGIIGGVTNKPLDQEALLGTIAHRGPDNKGLYVLGEMFLGHTRLSIQDLSEKANQPMFSGDGGYVIIFNGEIYNHQEIRQDHLQGVHFITSGDTETVLQAYIHFGADCLKLLNGIFAFAIFDIEKNELFIARDHFGIKPLYIYEDEHQFLFGSEIKSFLQFDIDKTISYEALENYITFLWSPGELTPFRKIKKLLPGHYIRFDVRNKCVVEQRKYYSGVPTGGYANFSEQEAIDALDKLLTEAVERQLLSDVPVGFFLSGGLDSTLLVAIAKKLRPNDRLECFTIDTSEFNTSQTEGFADDLFFAKKAAQHLGVELNIVKADFSITRDFDKMIWHLDEPQADAAPLNVLSISRLAREKNIKVLIGGAAGDDLFSGYRRHVALRYEVLLSWIPAFLKKAVRHFSLLLPVRVPVFRRIRKMSANIDSDWQSRLIGFFNWLPPKEAKALFCKEARSVLATYDSQDYFKKLLGQVSKVESLLDKMLYLELKTFLPDHNLNYTDKMAMAVGVEARVPYLDVPLVEFAQKLRPELKMQNGETKYLLKKVAERYIPKEIIYRPKSGFGAPVRQWITNDMREMINTRLSADSISEQGIFDPAQVKSLIERNSRGEIDASYNIWALLAIDSWMRQFNA